MKRFALALLVALAGCEVNGATAPVDPTAPTNLGFELTPSGDPNVPLGVLLTWNPPPNGQAVTYNVYGRSNSTGWILRATTTSTSFHDVGVPQAQYYVIAVNDRSVEMGRSNTITIDLTTRLPAPMNLVSITLNSAVQLSWSGNSVQADPEAFDHYRIYSAEYNSARGTCVEPWYFEGSTVSDAFFVGNLTNGSSRCFAVSAVSHDGHESTWSNARVDTPRPDAKSVMMYVAETKADSAAFVFNDEILGRLGIVASINRADADFALNRHTDGTIWLTPARVGVAVRAYTAASIADLTVIDRAPASGYQSTSIQVQAGVGYVFKVDEANGTHYAAVRAFFSGSDMLVFDWAYQIGIGNPELTVGVGGMTIKP